MDSVAVGFWGAFFGAAGLLLVAALLAFLRSARRIAFTGSVSALLSAGYVAVYLGWVPVHEPGALLRLQAHVAAVSAGVLGLLLFGLVGALRQPRVARLAVMAMALLALAVVWGGWLLSPRGALALGAGMEALVAALALGAALRTAVRGARPGWFPVAGITAMAIAAAVLTWHAWRPAATPWPLHALGALAAIGYLVAMATAMWVRYAWLIEVREAMAHGPSFDPVTRLRSHYETRSMVTEAFHRAGRPLGVLVVSIGNLEALEQLHGRAAYNHGLFVCANRLRRLSQPGLELGRVGDDGFLLLVRRPAGADALIELAQQAVQRLRRPVVLGTSQDLAELETRGTEWVADVGVGVLVAQPDMRPATAVAGARAMSRTAWSYASRVACYDEDARQIAELTTPPPAR